MHKALLLSLALLFAGQAFPQSKTFSEWQTEFDNHVSGSFSFGRHSNMADFVAAPYMAVDISDKYWDAFALVNGYTYAWMASGDSKYLDFVLDVVQRDIENAVNMSTANPPPQSSNYQGWNFKAFLAKPNYFGSGSVNLATYINNADPLTTGYGRRTASPNNTSAGTYITLDEGMYNRNIAQLARVMNANIGSIGSQISNNGQTYQQRLDILISHLRDQVWARNFENPNVDNNHYGRDIYRVNSHMSSHLAMVALCLYSIEGDTKYRDFVEEFLWDFGGGYANYTQCCGSVIAVGEGFLDKLEYQAASDSYWWVAPWGKSVGQHVLQDASHAVAEFQLLKACYEEGIGLNPPDGEPAIDLQFMQRMSNSIQEGYLKGYVCADGSNEPSVAYRLDGSGLSYGLMSSTAAYAEFNSDIQCYLDQRTSGIDLQKIGTVGAAMYTARVLGVGGDTGPAYTPTGSGVTPGNFRPQVVSAQGNLLELVIGDPYIEQGATWTDVEDGSGTILVPTSGSVPVDGSNNTNVTGTFNLTYTYTDGGGLSDSDVLTVEVTNGANTRPQLTLSYQDTTITQFGTYTPPTYSWTDIEDGTGTTGAVIGGDVVDTSTPGVYNVSYALTDTGGLTDTDFVVVRVEAFASVPVQSIVLNDNRPFYLSENSLDFPGYTIYPVNATNPGLNISVSDPSIVEIQETGEFEYQFLALQPGITTFTLTSQDNPLATVSGTLVVRKPNSVITIIIQND